MLVKKLIILFVIFLSFGCKNHNSRAKIENPNKILKKEDHTNLTRLHKKINELNSYLENKNRYNKEIAFLLDMKISSGSYRFFVVDLKKKKIIKRGLVAHGYGSNILNSDSLQFSNIPNSFATSIGIYSIGNFYYGDYGKSYKLLGLDNTNSNAYVRDIVLHSYKYVPEHEVEGSICNSKGCPMLSSSFFKEIDTLIEHSSKSILLYIYY